MNKPLRAPVSGYARLEQGFRRLSALQEAAGMLHWDMSAVMPDGGRPPPADRRIEHRDPPRSCALRKRNDRRGMDGRMHSDAAARLQMGGVSDGVDGAVDSLRWQVRRREWLEAEGSRRFGRGGA